MMKLMGRLTHYVSNQVAEPLTSENRTLYIEVVQALAIPFGGLFGGIYLL